jgi:hypothetical protein
VQKYCSFVQVFCYTMYSTYTHNGEPLLEARLTCQKQHYCKKLPFLSINIINFSGKKDIFVPFCKVSIHFFIPFKKLLIFYIFFNGLKKACYAGKGKIFKNA